MLPTFLGIGAPRAGTTWLYKCLDSHPEVCVPAQRKEVHFFDRHFERGLEWYESFFPAESISDEFKAVGEITPHYLYCEQCPQRIAKISEIERLIVILRNPVERVFSHYLFRMRIDDFKGDFEKFLEKG